MTANRQRMIDIVADELGVHSDEVFVCVQFADLDSLDRLGVAMPRAALLFGDLVVEFIVGVFTSGKVLARDDIAMNT